MNYLRGFQILVENARMIKLNLSDYLENELRRRQISLSKLASETGISKATLHGWLSGVSPKLTPKNIAHLESLSDYLGVSVLKLLLGELRLDKTQILFSSTFRDGKSSYKLTVEKLKE